MTIEQAADDPKYRSFGAKVTGVGDVNNDGFADIAVSAPEADVNGKRGAVYIYAGGQP
jgi:hypothetical protein